MIFLELGIRRDVEQPAMPDIEHGWNPGDRVGLGVRSDMLEATRPFGHEEGAVGQKCQGPRHFERARHAHRGRSAFGKHEVSLLVGAGGPGLRRWASKGEQRGAHSLESEESSESQADSFRPHDSPPGLRGVA